MKAVRNGKTLMLADGSGLGMTALDEVVNFGGRGQYRVIVHTDVSVRGHETYVSVTYAGNDVDRTFRTVARVCGVGVD